MSNLPILEKNAYLSLVVSNNGIWTHLAYTDHNADREYILSDFTDLNPLKQRLDDEIFNKNFWYDYFNNLEKVFNWNIVDREGFSVFSFRNFLDEGDGLSGIRVLMDESQPYFNKIFSSLRAFSNDIALRIMDDSYLNGLVDGLAKKLDYDDLAYVQMDLLGFKIVRSFKNLETGERSMVKTKISWGNEYGLIDSIKDSRFKAFMTADVSSGEMLNEWSNFILNRTISCDNPNIQDVIRAYATIQFHSMYQDSKEKLNVMGLNGKTAVIISGLIPMIIGKQKTLLSLIDGLEIGGTLDAYFDQEQRVVSYGRSYIAGPSATDIILTRKEIISVATKIYIPELRNTKRSSVVIMNGYTDSLEGEKEEMYILSPEFTLKELPLHRDKLIVEGEFKNGAYIQNSDRKESFSFISIPGKQKYDSLLVDARPKPVVYGPDIYANKLKLQQWIK